MKVELGSQATALKGRADLFTSVKKFLFARFDEYSDICYDVIVTKNGSSGIGHQVSFAYLFTFLAKILDFLRDFQILWYSFLGAPGIKVQRVNYSGLKMINFLILYFLKPLSLVFSASGQIHFFGSSFPSMAS